MDKRLLVYVDLNGKPRLAGRLWARSSKGKESASFEYDDSWLKSPVRFALEPALTLGKGPHHTLAGRSLFGAIGDSAPDRWGRVLIQREERRKARAEGRATRTVTEVDYLLGVGDIARQGALRFAEKEGGPFLAVGDVSQIPPLVKIPELLTAADHIATDKDTEHDLKVLLAPGSSLGGSRPKASVIDRDGQLLIAKFPEPNEKTPTPLWEAVALKLAADAGIAVPKWRIEHIGKRPVLLLNRFDRDGGKRIPFLSAMSVLSAKDNEPHSYIEIADALREHGAKAEADCAALWRRIVFNMSISNTDDHLRNHGFLYESGGWRLSPAYDLNPTPIEIKPRNLSLAVDEADTSASLGLAMEVAKNFGLKLDKARAIAAEVSKVVSHWQRVASALGLTAREIEAMSSAFAELT